MDIYTKCHLRRIVEVLEVLDAAGNGLFIMRLIGLNTKKALNNLIEIESQWNKDEDKRMVVRFY